MLFTQTYQVARDDYANAGKVSSLVKNLLKQLGINPNLLRRIAVACYEAEINMIIHAYGGHIDLMIDEEKIKLVFEDSGPGIADVEKALMEGYSTADTRAREMGFGAGMGLPNIRRVSDEFDLKTSTEGTRITLGFNL